MDEVYVVDSSSSNTRTIERAAFSAMGVHERQDLQAWMLDHPEILGEPLCIVTSEFSGFDKSSRRLDLLALDTDASLVVIELKLEVKGTFADLQALRYAAFCSTMTMEQVVQEYANHHKVSPEAAATNISEFLGVDDELPEPSDHPRIILVAGSMDDPEITSTVLWLRSFDIDIRCVEVTPYQIADGKILLVPRTIVPLPEAEEYQVRVEKKEATRARKGRKPGEFADLFIAVGGEYEKVGTRFRKLGRRYGRYQQVLTGIKAVHFEFIVRKKERHFDVAVHFEYSDAFKNKELLSAIEAIRARVVDGIDEPFILEPNWGKKWAYAAFRLPMPDEITDEYARRAAELMVLLIERTWPTLSVAVDGAS